MTESPCPGCGAVLDMHGVLGRDRAWLWWTEKRDAHDVHRCARIAASTGALLASVSAPRSELAAERAQQRFADAGMHLVRSTDPMASWPGLRLP